MISKVTMAEHEVSFEGFHMLYKVKLVEEYLEKSLTRNAICSVD